MITAALLFAGVAALINITPGLDTLLVFRASATHGKAAGVAAALGILTGCLGWGIATAAGLSALLAASRLAYDALRIAGAVYLIWLGTSALWRSWRDRASPQAQVDVEPPITQGRWAAYRAGVATNLLNPKAGVFYMSLIPQFIPPGAPLWSTTLLFTGIDLVELALWYWFVSGAAAALGERLRSPRFRRWLERVSGVAFLGFAANLLTGRH
ncbi:LysE family translocator [Actinomadura sp. 9N215]|uniref:LysE family translocator n=1 Tax=Actinomadura sp. 9N215 TaxID=3375150 RepID=UPI00378D4097